MDPQAELQDLDASLSEMTSLLLSEGDDDPFGVDGDFADSQGVVVDSRTAASHGVEAQLDEVQAAVAAALDEAATDLAESVGPEAEAPEPGVDISEAGDPGFVASGAATPVGPGSETEDAGDEPPEMTEPAPESEPKAEPDDGFEGETGTEADPESAAEFVDEAAFADDPTDEAPPMPATPADGPDGADAALQAVAESLGNAEPAGPGAESSEPEAANPPAGASAPKATPENQPTDRPSTKPSQRAPSVVTFKTRMLAIAAPLGRAVGNKAGDLLARGMEPVAASLAAQPRVMQQSLAWLALWTAFNAGWIWAYLVFFRSTGDEVDPAAITQISGAQAPPAVEGADGGPSGLDPEPAEPGDSGRE